MSGSYNLVPESVDGARTRRYGVGAYVTIFGLEIEHLDAFSPEDHARFHLRVFGKSLQNTSLTTHIGVRRRSMSEIFQQWYAGIDGQLYLHRHFGFTIGYRHHFQSIATVTPGTPFGHKLEAGLFLDYGFLRIFGKFMAETENRRPD